ncbi:hypothetical protein SAMN02744778_01953 [Pantoea sp. GL120224-02]|nr:hypothetical protein SAMN02744778_01953 [Pantoea sp. GL120224-02]
MYVSGDLINLPILLHTLHYSGVGCACSPRSHTGVWSRGLTHLPILLHTLHYSGVGCACSPRSHTGVCSRGLSHLPPCCSTNYFAGSLGLSSSQCNFLHLLPITYYLLPITYYLLPITYHLSIDSRVYVAEGAATAIHGLYRNVFKFPCRIKSRFNIETWRQISAICWWSRNFFCHFSGT